MGIKGTTRLIPLVGHPVAQVRSVEPMNRWFSENGRDVRVMPMDVPPAELAALFGVLRRTANCAGCTLTMPHKFAAFALIDDWTERAGRLRSVNVVRRLEDGRLIGDMVDGLAMVSALGKHGVAAAGRVALLIGAGGAGAAIADALAGEGVRSIIVQDTDISRRNDLIETMVRLHPKVAFAASLDPGTDVDIAINASPAGMAEGDDLPVAIASISRALIVADAVTRPPITRWLEKARAHGLPIQTGDEMAIEQVPLQLAFLGFREN